MLFELPHDGGLADIQELGHFAGRFAVPHGIFEHLFFEGGEHIHQVIDFFYPNREPPSGLRVPPCRYCSI